MTQSESAAGVKHEDIPVWNADTSYWEDAQRGDRIRSISRTISEGESMLFNTLVLDMHPYVGDEEFARTQGSFGRRVVPGLLVFAMAVGLVAQNNIHAFSYGYDRLRFIKPVFFGDTIYVVRTVLDKSPKYPDRGLVKVSYEVFRSPDQELLIYCEHLKTVRYHNVNEHRGETCCQCTPRSRRVSGRCQRSRVHWPE